MQAIFITIFISLLLVTFFLVLYFRERTGEGTVSSAERIALLPLEEGDAAEAKDVGRASGEGEEEGKDFQPTTTGQDKQRP